MQSLQRANRQMMAVLCANLPHTLDQRRTFDRIDHGDVMGKTLCRGQHVITLAPVLAGRAVFFQLLQ